MDRLKQQILLKPVSWKKMVIKEPFNRGFKEGMSNRPWANLDKFESWYCRWYEYGRHFSAYMKSVGMNDFKVKCGNSLNEEMYRFFPKFFFDSYGKRVR